MCDICASGILDELNKKRNWRPDRVIKWAGRKGLVIDQKQLDRHFKNHLPTNSEGKIKPARKAANQQNASKKSDAKSDTIKPMSETRHDDSHTRGCPADDQFLNEVIGRVFRDLTGDKFDLKLEHGFKAIEIRQKVADRVNVEDLLLDLLNEIRNQELAAKSVVDLKHFAK